MNIPWVDRALELATWSLTHNVVRTDAYLEHFIDEESKLDRRWVNQPLTLERIARHFRAATQEDVKRGDIISLAALALDSSGISSVARELTIDVDCHDAVKGKPAATQQAALAWYEAAKKIGFSPILENSSVNSYHLRIVFNQDVEAGKVRTLGLWITRDWKDHGLACPPEIFPKSDMLNGPGLPGSYGTPIRLFGRCPKYEFWSAIYNCSKWLNDNESIEIILNTNGDDPGLIPDEAVQYKKQLDNDRKRRREDIDQDDERPDVARVEEALSFIRDADTYDDWFHRGVELNSWDSSDIGLNLWIEWSKQSDKFRDGECEKLWNTFTPDVHNGRTIRSLFKAAVDNGWEPKPADNAPRFSNFGTFKTKDKDGKEEERRKSFRIGEIADKLNALAPGWPKRVEEELFIPSRDNEPVYLGSSQRFFAWIDSLAKVNWTKGSVYITQERFYEHLRMTCERFDAIETLPHWPAIPGIYYMHQEVPRIEEQPGCHRGDVLEQLLDFFCQSSPIDRELIKCLVLTLFWGGSPGARPAFLVTGPDQDPKQGRGVGKSKLCQVLAGLAGGTIDVLPTEDIGGVKTRLLSNESGRKRVVMLDNLKTFKFSWADLEGLITSPEISGKALYVGEGRRPNTLVWLITLNGATLSKDMAQRCVQIKLDRPTFKASWESEVRKFIRANRWGLIADIRSLLEARSPLLTPETRWGEWERDVLGKTTDWAVTQRTIKSRQEDIDDDDDERRLVAECFAEQLKLRLHDPDAETVLIPSLIAAEWVSAATRTVYPTNKASAFLSGLSIPTLRKSDRGAKSGGRGWVWTGKNAQREAAKELKPLPTWEIPVKRFRDMSK